jgi:uncharacterized protein YcnI
LILAASTATALFAGTAPAWALVEVNADNAVRGGEAILTFHVLNESDTGPLTTQFSVALPNLASARTELMPGWSAELDRDTAAGTTRSVTWTAPPNGRIVGSVCAVPGGGDPPRHRHGHLPRDPDLFGWHGGALGSVTAVWRR